MGALTPAEPLLAVPVQEPLDGLMSGAVVAPRLQVGLFGWFIGYPAPSQFFERLRCRAPDPARFCSPAIDRLMDQALALQTTDPAAADKLWERVDRALTDQAAWIPYATPRQHRFVDKRVGNHQSHPIWGTLLDQLWVR